MGRQVELCVPVRELSPRYVPGALRVYTMLYGALFGVIVCSAALWLIHNSKQLPDGVSGYLAHWPLIGLIASLITAIRYTPRVEYYTFCNQWGRPVFSIVREKKQWAECDAFIVALVAEIELAHSEMNERERREVLRPLLHDLQTSALVTGDVLKWKISLALGGAAILLPVMPGVVSSLGELLFFLEFSLCVVAMAFGVLAIWNREPNRWWGVLGFIFGLAPLFIY